MRMYKMGDVIDMLYRFDTANGVDIIAIDSIQSIRTKQPDSENDVVYINIFYEGDRREQIVTDEKQANAFINYILTCYKRELED